MMSASQPKKEPQMEEEDVLFANEELSTEPELEEWDGNPACLEELGVPPPPLMTERIFDVLSSLELLNSDSHQKLLNDCLQGGDESTFATRAIDTLRIHRHLRTVQDTVLHFGEHLRIVPPSRAGVDQAAADATPHASPS